MKNQFSFDDSSDKIQLSTAWQRVLRRISPDVPPAWFAKFLEPLRPVCMEGAAVRIGCPGRFVYEWVRERYLIVLQGYLSDEIGRSVTIELVTEARERAAANAVVERAAVPAPIAEPSFRPIPKFSFASFVAGQSNRLALAGAQAVAAEPGVKYNPLFIYGPSGLGKTHLLHAIAGATLAANPGFHLVYATAQQFAEEFIAALQSNRIDQFRRQQRAVGLWLLDDIQFIAGKDKTSEEVFHTFNYLHSLGKQIVITSDRSPRELNLMDERLRSRFESGLVADVQMPDTETRCAIIQSKAEQEKVDLSAQVAMYLAECVPGNIRVLEGALTKLAVQASVSEEPISLGLAQQMVERYYRAGAFAKPGVGQIIKTVGKYFNIPGDDIMGGSRKAPIVQARHVAVFITRELTGDSWKQIGSLFGGKDHTSMMHGYHRISDMMQNDADLRSAVKTLMRNLHPDA